MNIENQVKDIDENKKKYFKSQSYFVEFWKKYLKENAVHVVIKADKLNVVLMDKEWDSLAKELLHDKNLLLIPLCPLMRNAPNHNITNFLTAILTSAHHDNNHYFS